MYAQRFADGPRFRPVSMGVALAINGGVIAALIFAGPDIVEVLPRPPLISEFIPLPQPSPTPQPTPTARARTDAPTPAPTAADRPDLPLDDAVETVTLGDGPIVNPGGGTVEPARPVSQPAFVAAVIDPRFERDLQPPYPDNLRDAGVEGVVRLRVLIGADGRVKQAEAVSGDAVLARVATRHAFARWRFHPATRGAVPEDSWKVMSVRFRLNE